MTGYIPIHITFISRKPETIVNEWEDGGEINSFEASPTYVATNEKTVESGKSWARGWGGHGKITTTESENKPFKSLRVTSYEKRSEGGGAFKAIADDKWYVDLRTDTLLDILVNHSIKNGEVQGAEFIWARVGSQAKVVRVGSSLHAKLVESTALDKVKPPKTGDLIPGDVWESKNGDQHIFLGFVSTIEMKHEGSTSYSDTYALYPYNHRITLQRVPKIQCWFGVDKPWDDKEIISPEKALKDWGPYDIDLRKSISFRKKVKNVKIPANWIEINRRVIEKHISEMKNDGFNKGSVRPCDLAYLCALLHVAPAGQQVDLHPEYAAFKHLLT